MKASFLSFTTLIMILAGCGLSESNSDKDYQVNSALIDQMTWMNEPEFKLNNGTLSVEVTKGTDFFNNPEDSSIIGSAPFLFINQDSDFVMKALVEPDFNSQWNALSLMVYLDSLNWIKFAFENSDATGPSVVSVVTKGISDDANGVAMKDRHRIWLAVARKNHLYSMHWSEDGSKYYMARLTAMPNKETVRIGIEAQSPVGLQARHKVLSFDVAFRTVNNLRNINE
jgi:hypothetical protein